MSDAETTEARIRRRLEEVAEKAANAEDALDCEHSPDTIALGVVLAEELRIARAENVKEMARMLDTATARLREEIDRATGCQRCDTSGTITDRNGDLDECPECQGTGR